MHTSSDNPTSASKPKHVAIIMDGNGRWAKARGLPRIEGHRKGAESVKRALEAARKHELAYLTLYAFSVENWNRPKAEVDALMDLLDKFLKNQSKHLVKNKVRLQVIGRIEGLPDFVQKRIREVEAKTANYSECTLALALNYGARSEIVDATKRLMQAAVDGSMHPEDIDYTDISQHLYTAEMPDPDLLIRTSGEIRLSNFLLLQCAYSEIHFTDVLWPDFSEADFDAAMADYARRERRYGKTGEQLRPR